MSPLTQEYHSRPQPFIGVVMAGGKSSRMGTDKSKMMRIGQTMEAFTAQCLRQAGAQDVLISLPFGERQTKSNRIADKWDSLGPLGGIHTILQQVYDQNSITRLLFVPVDLPLLKPSALEQLARHPLQSNGAAIFQQQPLPLLLEVSAFAVTELSNIIERKQNLSIFHFLDNIGVTTITNEDPDALTNSNDPMQWQNALQKLGDN